MVNEILNSIGAEKSFDIFKIVFGSLLSSVLGATIALYISGRRRSYENAITLHKEFTTGELLKARNKAETILSKHPNELYSGVKDSISSDDKDSIWMVIHFYQRLYLAVHHGELRSDLVPDLFGEVFVSWWYTPFFENSFVPMGWSSCIRMDKLNSWFERKSKKVDYIKWRRTGNDLLIKLIDRNTL